MRTTILQTCSVSGIAIGSILGPPLLKNGTFRTLQMANLMGLIVSLLSIVDSYGVICTGRFLHGVIAGILVNTASKILDETVPAAIMDNGFGTSTNLMIIMGIMATMLIGIGLPPEDEYGTSNYWRLFYLLPVPTFIIEIALGFFVFWHETIVHYAQKNDRENGIKIIKKIYHVASKEEAEGAWQYHLQQ